MIKYVFLAGPLLLIAGCNKPPEDEPKFLGKSASDLISLPLRSQVDKDFTCIPKSKFICTSEGCEPGLVSISMHWDAESSLWKRCDNKGCDTYQIEKNSLDPNMTTNTISFASGGAFAKIISDGHFSEVVSLLDSVVVYNGKCTPDS